MSRKILLLWAIACLLLNASMAGANEWESCNIALQALRSASRRASLETLETPRKDKQLKECLRYPDNTYQMYRERCQRLGREYKHQVDEMKTALLNVQAAMYKVELSCYGFSSSGPGRKKSLENNDLQRCLCLRLKQQTWGLTRAQRFDFCKKMGFPGNCTECMAIPSQQ